MDKSSGLSSGRRCDPAWASSVTQLAAQGPSAGLAWRRIKNCADRHTRTLETSNMAHPYTFARTLLVGALALWALGCGEVAVQDYAGGAVDLATGDLPADGASTVRWGECLGTAPSLC